MVLFKNKVSLLSIRNHTNSNTHILFVLIALLYFYNFHVNDFWTPNESFYAESVREMFESGNFLDIQYNYRARYNKPPLTYWIIAASSSVFGINEFGIRLPIILLALGSIWLTYLMGKDLFGEKGGFYAMIIYALGLQLLSVKQYASPETPLTFFFTLTLFWFYRAYTKRSNKLLLLSYVALGLTTLTKGFPYIIIIGSIVIFFLLLKNWKQWNQLWADIKWIKLPLGILIVGLIGVSWVIYMYLEYGDDFWNIYYTETFGRALDRESKGLKPFFYVGVVSWSIIPYSLVFFYALIYWIRNRTQIYKVILPIAWFTVMFVIFTISKGKIPTYIIQAHPAFALFLVPIFLESKKLKIFSALNLIMSFLIVGVSFYLLFELNLHGVLFIFPVAVLCFLIFASYKYDQKQLQILPFWAMLSFMIIFGSFLPKVEKLRPYDTIGEEVKEANIDSTVPLHLDSWLIHNLPFYTERKALREQSPETINKKANSEEILALVPSDHLNQLDFQYTILWEGLIYDFASESQFFKFIMAANQALEGNNEKFRSFTLIYKP